MGAFPAAIFTTQAEGRERKKERREERIRIASEREREDEKKKEQQERGRISLIKTTPRGVLGAQNSGRKRLTPA